MRLTIFLMLLFLFHPLGASEHEKRLIKAYGFIDDVSHTSKPSFLRYFGSELIEYKSSALKIKKTILRFYDDVSLLSADVAQPIIKDKNGKFDLRLIFSKGNNFTGVSGLKGIIGLSDRNEGSIYFTFGFQGDERPRIQEILNEKRFGYSKISEKLSNTLSNLVLSVTIL